MSIQFKIPLYILVFFIFNILFIGLYYNLKFSGSIAAENRENYQTLSVEVFDIARGLEDDADYRETLSNLAGDSEYVFKVKSLSGDLIFETGEKKRIAFDVTAAATFSEGAEELLLEVTRPISLGFLSSINLVTELLIAEIIIIAITLFLLNLFLYMNTVRPLVGLQRNMELYKLGIKPTRTARKDEIGLLQNGFAELADSLDREKQLQYRIIASISHDIKTPLTSVMGYAERLQNENISKERFDSYLRTIYAKSRRIQELVEEFDDYISFSMEPALSLKRITAGQLCARTEEEYRDELSSLGIRFSVTCSCPGSLLEVDLPKISRVFGNLIGNSIKYAASAEPEIAVLCEEKDGSTLFSVSDNGPGVGKEHLEKIFEPFYTSDASRRVAGLGLSICRTIVENHGGTIWAESGDQGGLTIRFLLKNAK
ncbi:sensor histidine kinase [Papillibacter cinnamivorans]|uniref:histidine kinase n=1 Tax=Papillibacter cinnamivorans DSM 12816 TaxID=1122930 RepID=A0A1W1ZFE9_9FIRM|nr:HAMP domain-containing sensor histidine kinase [Papillibacter cinnamivorans]SMC47219.1 His Kinase A (phospho-acceptor) domain-containing protein [Papillibacter cinnamivorans DSM 12816]